MERKNTHRLILSEFHKGFCTVICMYSDFKFTAASVVIHSVCADEIIAFTKSGRLLLLSAVNLLADWFQV